MAEMGMDPLKDLKPSVVPGHNGLFDITHDPVYKAIRRIHMRLEIPEEGEESGSRKERDLWEIDDEVEKLDVLSTIESMGVAVPGVTTVKSSVVSDPRGVEMQEKVAILLDASGSMRGRKFITASAGAATVAERILSKGGTVAIIPFAHGVREDYILENGKNMDVVLDFLAGIIPNGGTSIRGAIRWARILGIRRVVVITDTHLADWERVANDSYMKVQVIAINDGEEVEKWIENLESAVVISAREILRY
jgi:Mg-chelatase subunit ChlD